MTEFDLFVQALRASEELPADVRLHAHEARGVGTSCFDETYLQFLEEQIRLGPRGPEWTEVLRKRRKGLHQFCGIPLLRGHIRVGRFDTSIHVDPKSKTVVFWEQLELGD